MHADELASIEGRWEPRYRPGGRYLAQQGCTFDHGGAVRDIGRLVAEVRRLQAELAAHVCEGPA